MKIYVIFGTTGEYSDRSEWPVMAYKDESKADEHVHNAQLRALEISHKYKKAGTYYNSYTDDRERNEYDPYMRIEYTGTEYYIEEVELKED